MPHKYNKIASTLVLGFGSLGTIYGDIGTSPLYTLSSVVTSTEEKEIMGALSCIFWVFTVIVVFKYCCIVLIFGPNHNEGGQIAIYSKIASKLKLRDDNTTVEGQEDIYHSASDDLVTLTRASTIDTSHSMFANTFVKGFVSFVSLNAALLGCCLVFSDGLLTPTTSVLSAVAGIAIAKESLTDKVMPISVAILFMLFVAQRFGTGKLSILFSPIMLLWTLTLIINGIYWIAHKPMVLKALNPAYAFKLLAMRKDIDVLSPVMLAITGTEAMFADISHFGALPVQLTMICFVYPCLICAYLGQGAFILIHPEEFSSNVFYTAIPFGGVGSAWYWIVFVLATLATIIASQALILGCFSILKQLITLDCFPRMRIVHTSRKHRGRVYVPLFNLILMVAVILCTVGFRNSNNVTAAYGLGISIDFILTSILISFTLHYVYGYHWIFSVAFFLFFGSLEVCFVIAGLRKVPHGAWFPLAVCTLVFSFISFWRACRRCSLEWDASRRTALVDMFSDRAKHIEKKKNLVLDLGGGANNQDTISKADDRESAYSSDSFSSESEPVLYNYHGEMVTIPKPPKVMLIYCSSYSTVANSQSIPCILDNIVGSFMCLPEICVFVETRIAMTPDVPENNLPATILPIEAPQNNLSFYRCVIKSGFLRQTKIDNKVLKSILEQIGDFEDDDKMDEMPVLHVFERNLTVAKKFKTTSLVSKLCAPLIWIRSWTIDWLYSPMNNGSMFYLLDEDLVKKRGEKDAEFVYVGSQVQI